MKTSKEYFKESVKELGADELSGIPTLAVTQIALIKAMKDFSDELTMKDIEKQVYDAIVTAFQFNTNGDLLIKDSDKL